MNQVRQELFAGSSESIFDDRADTSGLNKYYGIPKHGDVDSNGSDNEDELNVTGDIGIGLHIYASYQKSGYKSAKSRLIMSDIDGYEDDDGIDINTSSPKPTQSSSSSFLWLRHPKVRENWKTVAGAIFLLVVGILFLICGIVLSALPKHDGPKSIIFFVCAGVCILPGGYHTVYIYRATKGWRGYNFESLPNFR